MLSGVKLNCVSQNAQVILCCGFSGLPGVRLKDGQSNSGEDAEDSNCYQ